MNDTKSQSYLTDVRSRLPIHLNCRSEELPPIRGNRTVLPANKPIADSTQRWRAPDVCCRRWALPLSLIGVHRAYGGPKCDASMALRPPRMVQRLYGRGSRKCRPVGGVCSGRR